MNASQKTFQNWDALKNRIESCVDVKSRVAVGDSWPHADFTIRRERYNSDEERKQAQRNNALKWFYRKKLINTWNYYWCDEINKMLAKRYKARVEKERNKVKFTPIIDDSEEKTSSE